MTYIINPWFFYFIGIAEGLKAFFSVFTAISALAIIFLGVFLAVSNFDVDVPFDKKNDELIKTLAKWFKRSIIATIVFALMLVITPTSATLNKMMISSLVTKENLETVKTNAKDLIDYIAEKAEELKEK